MATCLERKGHNNKAVVAEYASHSKLTDVRLDSPTSPRWVLKLSQELQRLVIGLLIDQFSPKCQWASKKQPSDKKGANHNSKGKNWSEKGANYNSKGKNEVELAQNRQVMGENGRWVMFSEGGSCLLASTFSCKDILYITTFMNTQYMNIKKIYIYVYPHARAISSARARGLHTNKRERSFHANK